MRYDGADTAKRGGCMAFLLGVLVVVAIQSIPDILPDILFPTPTPTPTPVVYVIPTRTNDYVAAPDERPLATPLPASTPTPTVTPTTRVATVYQISNPNAATLNTLHVYAQGSSTPVATMWATVVPNATAVYRAPAARPR